MWELFKSLNRVVAKVVSTIIVNFESIYQIEMEATNHGGNKNGLLQNMKYMKRASIV